MESYSNVTSKGEPFDLKLNEEVFHKKTGGFYIELGAFDGIIQSNTAFFEFYKNWSGILIEPSREKYKECVKNRPKSMCYNIACSSAKETQVVLNHENGLMSKVTDNGEYACKSTSLELLLNEQPARNIDFLSLDVEGFELDVLCGLNLNKYRPNYMLIELWTFNEESVKNFLEKNEYECLCNFSNYNHIDNPTWGHDGQTHNDFLFIDKLIPQ